MRIRSEKMKRLIDRRCNERSEIIIAIHMYIRCGAERVAGREVRRGWQRGSGEYFSPPLLVIANRYCTITTIIIIVIAIILLL